MKISIDDLYIVVTTGFMIFSGGNDVYTDKEEAEANARERQKNFPDLTFKVWDLADYISEVECKCSCC